MHQQTIEIVGFAQELLKRQECPFCNHPFQLSDVMAQGNRRGKDGKSYYYYETQCSGCSQPSMTVVTSRPMDSKGLMVALSEHYKGGGHSDFPAGKEPDGLLPGVGKDATPATKSGISDDEVENAKRMLDKSKSFDDVLRGLGMSGDTIERYMREGKKLDEAGDDASQ